MRCRSKFCRTASAAPRRWVSPDPVAGSIGNPQSLNRYAYVVNGPLTGTDPLGLKGDRLDISGWGSFDLYRAEDAFNREQEIFRELNSGSTNGNSQPGVVSGPPISNVSDLPLSRDRSLLIAQLGQQIDYLNFASANIHWLAMEQNPNGTLRDLGWNVASVFVAAKVASLFHNLSGIQLTGFNVEVEGTSGAARTPSFVVTPAGEVIPIPQGASGPNPVVNGKGVQYNGGSGGNGLAANVTDVRIMDPTPYAPNGYVNYGSRQANGGWQSVNPYTGQAVGKTDSWWHILLRAFSNP